MKLSLKWLNEYVDIKDYFTKPEELGEILTRAGLEVEDLQNRAKDLNNVVIGYILEKDKHPNADKLSLCRVTTGEGVMHQIVCGAQNHKKGDFVVVALPGAVLPGNFAIKQAQVRGVDSGGMLCSTTELGMSEKSDGILILPENSPLGKPFAEYAGLDDVVLELKVTPNRADCLSHFGLAREIACLLKRELKPLNHDFQQASIPTAEKMKLSVQDTELCPRYCGIYIDQVKVGPSPDWLKARVESVGLKSINNIVDITNFVMMELGQPLHAFDADQIQDRKILVAKAHAGEKFVTLDGTELTLTGEELTIRDSSRALCLAGVIGGKNSGVSDQTQSIFLESAYFLPATTRKTSRGHGVETDSAYRFSRGVDPEGAMKALIRAAGLIQKVSGAQVYSDPLDIKNIKSHVKPISMTLEFVSQKLGFPADEKLFVDYLNRLGCGVQKIGDGFEIIPPSYRFDLEQAVDFVEEYARIHGYEHIPETLPVTSVEPVMHDKGYLFSRQLSRAAQAAGYRQAFNFAFVGNKKQKEILGDLSKLKSAGLTLGGAEISLLNPLSEDLNIMRSNLTFGLIQNMFKNFHHGNKSGRLYELGQCFYQNDHHEYLETMHFSTVAWGHDTDLWMKEPQHNLIFEAKGMVESVLEALGIQGYQWIQLNELESIPDFCHQGQFAALKVQGKLRGFISSLHPGLLDAEKIRVPVVIFEMELDGLTNAYAKASKVRPISKFPVIERDLALVSKAELEAEKITKLIQKVAGPLLVGLKIFDLYQGDKLEKGKKSLAYRLYFQDQNATLQDSQVLEIQNKLIAELNSQLGVTIR